MSSGDLSAPGRPGAASEPDASPDSAAKLAAGLFATLAVASTLY